MEVNKVTSPKLVAYLALAHQFVTELYAQHVLPNSANTQTLIEELLRRLDKSNKEDRILFRNLKSLKALIDQCDGFLPKDQSELEEKLRGILLNCGFDAKRLDNPILQEKQEATNESAKNSPYKCEDEQYVNTPKIPSSSKSVAESLNEEGNTYYKAKDFQKAMVFYEKILVMPGVANETFVKAASNQIAALVAWHGATAVKMKEALTYAHNAILRVGPNAKVFYRISQGYEWLEDIHMATFTAMAASTEDPTDELIRKRLANLKQKCSSLAAHEHLDERYRPQSEKEMNDKISQQFRGLDMNPILDYAKTLEVPEAFVARGHMERDFNKNYVAAAECYQKAADAGNPEGLLNSAYLYTKGMGVEQNLSKAVELLRDAVLCDPSKLGVVESYTAVGMKYWHGIAVPQSNTEAKLWFRKAADLGFSEGELNLGIMLEEEEEYCEAKDLLESAAMRGCARAYAALGDIYRDGRAVKIDLNKARKMYEKAVYHGYSLNIENELKSDLTTKSGGKMKWQAARLNNLDRVKVTLTADTVDDLEKRKQTSPTARTILLGWESAQRGSELIGDLNSDREVLKLYSIAFRYCGPIIELEPGMKEYLIITAMQESMVAVGAEQIDAIVCCSFFRCVSPSVGTSFAKCAFALAKAAVDKAELKEKGKALVLIKIALALEPSNVDLLFYKARVTESIEDFLHFTEIAPLDHYWRPRAFYCIAEQWMKKNQVDEVFKYYELGVEAEKHQLLLFRDVELDEKNEVAYYLISERKLNRHPSRLKVNQHRRKELLVRRHNAIKNHFEGSIPKDGGVPFIWKVGENMLQPNPASTKEYFLEDLDLSKEHIYEGFIDCMIIAPPIKKFDIVTVVEDKKGNTSRILLYEDVSLVYIKVGQWIRLYNPYVRIARDNRSALKVTNTKCFEVLQFEKICHCCTRIENSDSKQFAACPRCKLAYYCSGECYEKHQNEFEHKVACRYLRFNNKQSL